MNLAVFLAIGESIEDFKIKGQDSLIINNNYKEYSKNFSKVFVFSYKKETYKFFNNVYVIPNKFNIHRFIYVLLIPFINLRVVHECKIIRCYQITGGLTGLAAKLFFNKRYVVNYGYDYPDYAYIEGKKVLSIILRIIEAPILYFASSVIATSKLLTRKVLKFNKNVVLIPNGVDINLFRPKKTRQNIDLLYVGRFEAQKNLDWIIKAVDLLYEYKLSVIFIGSGSLKTCLINLAQVHNVNLKIIKNISNNLLPKYYNHAKVFILPSKIEGNPKSLLEAMSCSAAVIGNNVSGISSIINGSNGLLFNNTVRSLAEKIDMLMKNDNLRRNLGKETRSYISKNYNFKTLFAKEILLLKKLE